ERAQRRIRAGRDAGLPETPCRDVSGCHDRHGTVLRHRDGDGARLAGREQNADLVAGGTPDPHGWRTPLTRRLEMLAVGPGPPDGAAGSGSTFWLTNLRSLDHLSFRR